MLAPEAIESCSRISSVALLLLAGVLARRNRNWAAVAGFALVGLAMATILIFGLLL